jgi:hypothetical protein
LEDAQESRGAHGAGREAAGDAQQVVPVRGDEAGVDLVAGEAVEGAVVGGAVDAPDVAARRSVECTTTVSPSRTNASIAASCGRAVLLPEALSVDVTPQPDAG